MKEYNRIAKRHSGVITKRTLKRLALHLVLIAGGITVIAPFAWMVSTSLKHVSRVFVVPPEIFPRALFYGNYFELFDKCPYFFRYLINSFFVSITVTLGQLVCCSMGAYAFSRLRFPGRDKLFILYLATMMIPYQVTLIPTFILIRYLHWIDTYYALIIPGLFGAAFGTFLLRQFFLSIPKELEDAATIDGCGYFRIYAGIILPLSKPALVVLGVLMIMWTWNDFLWPLLVINSESMKTLTLGLRTVGMGYYSTHWPLVMAAATIGLLPMLVLFFFAQKYFMHGIQLGGLKG